MTRDMKAIDADIMQVINQLLVTMKRPTYNQLEQELLSAAHAYASLYECLNEYGVSLAEARGLGPTL